ncbi:superoxide dismutase [Streptobacillus moniliformis]|uniref:Superoxide dismutase n=1 Tax=Streptobacillus moniliformis (strain ATCC 14647 / DSM 12112 / NCTC 10651 / 9901) TaxID=519441 RepID=D1AVC9_STRM9|nr:superoxide dismutase [Streptobacillus moniliformis]ACZ01689.1 Superoxide dismutase [Streptobacillus moniliformis DSM 12112]AVL43312.1 superoxide dismutase [Streptobacillus moniliformis]QXW66363.1 superoxide dismutase [Streptobacillus moniliformis]SQA13132.1 Superoxide dismutase [Mn] [Streptobacillus moniliformis]
MSIKLKDLPYAYDALEPVIDKETMHLHHDKHHNTYVTNLNNLIKGTEFENATVEEILTSLDKMPEEKRNGIKNNAGGTYNHDIFWETMIPGGSKEPVGRLKEAIDKTFGSFEEFKNLFNSKGLTQFGSGWVWLVSDKDGNLEVYSTSNQDCPLSDGKKIILCNDVWEHAYYLNYQNRRADYLKEWFNVVNWDIVSDRY